MDRGGEGYLAPCDSATAGLIAKALLGLDRPSPAPDTPYKSGRRLAWESISPKNLENRSDRLLYVHWKQAQRHLWQDCPSLRHIYEILMLRETKIC